MIIYILKGGNCGGRVFLQLTLARIFSTRQFKFPAGWLFQKFRSLGPRSMFRRQPMKTPYAHTPTIRQQIDPTCTNFRVFLLKTPLFPSNHSILRVNWEFSAMLIYTLIYSLLVFSNTYALDVLNSDVVVKNVGRSIDITSQLVKVVYQFTFENKGKNSEKYVLFAVEPQFKDKVAFVGSQVNHLNY